MWIKHEQIAQIETITSLITNVTKDLAPKYIFCPCSHLRLIPICAYLLRYTAKMTQFADILSLPCQYLYKKIRRLESLKNPYNTDFSVDRASLYIYIYIYILLCIYFHFLCLVNSSYWKYNQKSLPLYYL